LDYYDNHELKLNIKATFMNPFDPQDIDIQTTFTSPAGKKGTFRVSTTTPMAAYGSEVLTG